MTKNPSSCPHRPQVGRVLLPLVVALLFSAVAPPAAVGDAPDLVTDRPDQTESSVVVPKGSFQLEVGWLFTRDEELGVRVTTHEVPSSLLRVGLSETVELRVGWTGFVDSSVRFGGVEASADGVGDADVGAKVYLKRERGSSPEIALLFGTSVPVGDDAFTSDRFDPSWRLSFAHTLSDTVGLGYNVGMGFASEVGAGGDRDTLSTWLYTIALGFSLTERWGAFVELFGDVPGSAPGDPAPSFDGGFTYLVRDNLQLDVAAGAGLADAADDWFLGLGLSVRIPE